MAPLHPVIPARWRGGVPVVPVVRLTGVIGFRFGVSKRSGGARAAVAAGLILGGVAGGFAMLWLGQQIGLSAYNHDLASSPNGMTLHDRRRQEKHEIRDALPSCGSVSKTATTQLRLLDQIVTQQVTKCGASWTCVR